MDEEYIFAQLSPTLKKEVRRSYSRISAEPVPGAGEFLLRFAKRVVTFAAADLAGGCMHETHRSMYFASPGAQTG